MTRIYLISFILFATLACKKKNTSSCDFTIASATLSCSQKDTVSSINGLTTVYFPNGVDKKSEGHYTNGTPTGFWKFYYAHGPVHQEGHFLDGKRDGFWNVYYDNGHIWQQGQYLNCKRSGFWKYYHSAPDYAVAYEGNYSEGKRTGIWKAYDTDGQLIEEYNCSE